MGQVKRALQELTDAVGDWIEDKDTTIDRMEGAAIKARAVLDRAAYASNDPRLGDEPEHPDSPEGQMESIFLEALEVFRKRNAVYHDAWKRSGWRGLMFDIRKKVERAWDALWDADPTPSGEPNDVDDLLDMINYAACAMRAIREGNRDGVGGWW